jgi:SAM-dependent methyltransferase
MHATIVGHFAQGWNYARRKLEKSGVRVSLLSKRIIEAELLDHLPAEEARPNLADLVRINTTFGGHSAIRKRLAQLAKQNDAFTVLDIGAASGDTARLIRELYPRASITSLDNNFVNFEAAPRPKVMADAFQLPFAAESFDYVMCSLFLHHFTDEQVVALLRSFYSVAGCALLVCDLERHIFPYWFLPATKHLFGWNDVTVHDGRISVRAGFRLSELVELARRAGIRNPEAIAHRPGFRISVVGRKTQEI